MKKCKKCLQEKNIVEFYVRNDMKDGHANVCKKCTAEEVKKIDRRRYYLSDKARKAQAEYKRFYDKNDGKEGVRARKLLYKAVKSGKIKKKICVVCGVESVEAHHEDYNKPLVVIWMCKLHHLEKHNKTRHLY